MNTDKFKYLSVDLKNPTEKYVQPKVYTNPAATGGGAYPQTDIKTSGIQMRGFGAATKGKMSRGPMA